MFASFGEIVGGEWCEFEEGVEVAQFIGDVAGYSSIYLAKATEVIEGIA